MARIALIFLVFALIHSITVSAWFKDLGKRLFGTRFMQVWYRFLFTSLSMATALIALRLIQDIPDRPLWTAPPVLLWPMHALQAAAALFGALAFRHLDGMEFLGIRQVWRYLAKREAGGNIEGLSGQDLITHGVYGIVRHPLYVAGFVLVTFNPRVTVNGLVLTVATDLYFLLGMFIEERRFLRLFGDRYRDYMHRVPRMLPRFHAHPFPPTRH